MSAPGVTAGKKYLIVRFSAMGDIVLTSPVVRLLKEGVGAEVHVLTKARYAVLWKANPRVSRIHTIENHLQEVMPELRAEGFDRVIDLHANWRTLLLQWYLPGVPFHRFRKGSLLRTWHVLMGTRPKRMKHIVTRYVEALAPLGLDYDGKGLEFYPDTHPSLEMPQAKEPYLALVVGAGHFTKRIPVDKWLAIAKSWYPHPIYALGGEEDTATGLQLQEQSKGQITSLCGQLSPGGSAAWLAGARLVITGDTGLMHIAAALRRPMVSLWGGTIPEFGWLPIYPEGMNRNVSIQKDDLPCRPCSRFGRADCPRGHFRCMHDLPVQAVIDAGELLWKNNYGK